ncbi:MAG: tRNA (adenosine(37)-N6)-threonylcarbamoyltransferase complex ATPase subunit type 1 TsaE [Patescibacteria group bacterium]
MNHMQGVYVTGSAEETKELAKEFAGKLKQGITLCLFGELAAGKTTFTQGLGEYFGITRMTSPTYVIVSEYPLKSGLDHIKTLYHIDLYRLKSRQEAKAFDLDEIWSDPANLTVIEWPDCLENYLPKDRYEINFKNLGVNAREITMKLI